MVLDPMVGISHQYEITKKYETSIRFLLWNMCFQLEIAVLRFHVLAAPKKGAAK